jgi:hypothetical protein
VLRVFVMDADGMPRRLPLASYGPLLEGKLSVPAWAARPLLCAQVALWSEGRRPVRILRVDYHRYAADGRGRIAHSVQEAARLGLEIMGSRALLAPGAPRGRDRFLERQRAAFSWTPTPDQERAIGDMIYGGSRRPPISPDSRTTA